MWSRIGTDSSLWLEPLLGKRHGKEAVAFLFDTAYGGSRQPLYIPSYDKSWDLGTLVGVLCTFILHPMK